MFLLRPSIETIALSSSRSSRVAMNHTGGDSWRNSPSLSLIKFFRYTRELLFFPFKFSILIHRIDPTQSRTKGSRWLLRSFDEDSWLFFFAPIIPLVSLEVNSSFRSLTTGKNFVEFVKMNTNTIEYVASRVQYREISLEISLFNYNTCCD